MLNHDVIANLMRNCSLIIFMYSLPSVLFKTFTDLVNHAKCDLLLLGAFVVTIAIDLLGIKFC